MAVLDKLRLADLTKLSGCAAPSMQPSTSYRNVIFPSPDHWVELHNSPRLSDKQQAQMNQWLKAEQDVRQLRERISILKGTVQKLSSRLVKAGENQHEIKEQLTSVEDELAKAKDACYLMTNRSEILNMQFASAMNEVEHFKHLAVSLTSSCNKTQSALRAAHAREHSLSGEVFAVTQAKDNLQAALEAGAASEVKLRTRLREQKRRVVVAKSVQLQLKRQLRRERANAEQQKAGSATEADGLRLGLQEANNQIKYVVTRLEEVQAAKEEATQAKLQLRKELQDAKANTMQLKNGFREAQEAAQAALQAALEREQLSSRQVKDLEEARGRLEAEAQCSGQREVELRRRVWAQEILVAQAGATKSKLELDILNQSAQHKEACKEHVKREAGLKEKLKEGHLNVHYLQTELSVVKEDKAAVEQQLQIAASKAQEFEQHVVSTTKALECAEDEAKAAALRAAGAMQHIAEVEAQREDYRSDVDRIQTELTGAKGDNALLTAQIKEGVNLEAALQKRLQQLEEELRLSAQEAESKQAVVTDLQDELAAAHTSNESLAAKLQLLQQQYKKATDDGTCLKSLVVVLSSQRNSAKAALWEGIAEKHLLSNQVDELVAKVIKLERQVQCGAGREGRLAAQLQEQARQAADSRAALVKQLETQEGIHQEQQQASAEQQADLKVRLTQAESSLGAATAELVHLTTSSADAAQEATQAAQAAAAREQSLTSQARDLSAQVKLLTDASAGLQADVMRRSEQEATMKTSLSEQQLRASHAEHEVARLNKEVSLHKEQQQAGETRVLQLANQVSSLSSQCEAMAAARDKVHFEADQRVADMRKVMAKQELHASQAEEAVLSIKKETLLERIQLQEMVQAAAHREESLNKEIQGLLENAIRFEVDAKLSTNRSAALSAEVSRQRVLISEGHEALTSLKTIQQASAGQEALLRQRAEEAEGKAEHVGAELAQLQALCRPSVEVKEQPTAELLGPVESERQHSAALLRQSVNLALAVEPVHTTAERDRAGQGRAVTELMQRFDPPSLPAQDALLELGGEDSSRKSSSAASVKSNKENTQMRGKVTRVPSAFNQSQQQSADAAAAPHRPQATKAGPETEEPKPVLVPFNPRGSTAGSSSSVQAAPLGQQQRAHMDTLLQEQRKPAAQTAAVATSGPPAAAPVFRTHQANRGSRHIGNVTDGVERRQSVPLQGSSAEASAPEAAFAAHNGAHSSQAIGPPVNDLASGSRRVPEASRKTTMGSNWADDQRLSPNYSRQSFQPAQAQSLGAPAMASKVKSPTCSAPPAHPSGQLAPSTSGIPAATASGSGVFSRLGPAAHSTAAARSASGSPATERAGLASSSSAPMQASHPLQGSSAQAAHVAGPGPAPEAQADQGGHPQGNSAWRRPIRKWEFKINGKKYARPFFGQYIDHSDEWAVQPTPMASPSDQSVMIMSNPRGPYRKAQLAKSVKHGFLSEDTLVHHMSQTSDAGIPVWSYIAHWQQRHMVEYAALGHEWAPIVIKRRR